MDEALINSVPKTHRTYAIRWWLLCLCSLIAGNQGGMWLVYGVIAQAVKPLYGWTDATIALISQWGPICYVIAVGPTSYLLDVKGLRFTSIVASSLLLIGGICRIIHHDTDSTGTWLVHASQIFNGLVGPVAMSIAPPLSAQWFAPHERTFATAIAATCNYGGGAVFFVLGSRCVPPGPAEEVRNNLWHLMLGECIFCAGLLAACILTFPAAPAVAPSHSATIAREPPLQGLKQLARSVPFWLLTISFGIFSGTFQSWGSMLGPILQSVNSSRLPSAQAEAEAGWLGMYGAVAGIVGGVVLGYFADRMVGYRKMLLLIATALSTLGFAVFSLTCSDVPLLDKLSDTSQRALMFAGCIFGSLWANAATPLYFEMAAEATYPVAEGLTTSAITLIQNLFAFVVLAGPEFLPGVGIAWINWAVVCACILGGLMILPLSERQRRLAVDTSTSYEPACAPAG